MFKSVSSNTELCCRRALLVVIMVQFSLLLNGQVIWTSDQFLELDQNTINLPYEKNINFIDQAKGMPFVDRYDFRTETDEMDINQQRYQLRFQLNSRDERKAFDKIMIANKSKYKWLQAQYELDKWEERYNNIIDLYFNQSEMDLVKQDLELLADKKTVLKKILDNEVQVDVGDWLANEAELFKVQSDSMELELNRKEISQKLFGPDRLAPRLEASDCITVEEMLVIVNSILVDSLSHPDEGLAKAEEEVAQAEYQLEEAESRKWLEFAQIEYQWDDNLSFQRELSFGTSISLPSKGNNRAKKNEAALELLEKNYELRLEQEGNKEVLSLAETKMLSLIAQLESFQSMRRDQKLEETFESYVENRVVSPLILINIKRTILDYNKKELELEKDIYEVYIDILTRKAAFLKSPRRNYLKD